MDTQKSTASNDTVNDIDLANLLKVGDRVYWSKFFTVVDGTVSNNSEGKVSIRWDDNKNTVLTAVDPRWDFIEPEHITMKRICEQIRDEQYDAAARTILSAAGSITLDYQINDVIRERSKLFVEDNYTHPVEQDYHLIYGAMLVGASIALERSLNAEFE